MSFRVSEVAAVLTLLGAILFAKHLPWTAGLPLSQVAGVLSFSFAIYLALGIYRDELARIRAR